MIGKVVNIRNQGIGFTEEIKVPFHGPFHGRIHDQKPVDLVGSFKDPVDSRIPVSSFN